MTNTPEGYIVSSIGEFLGSFIAVLIVARITRWILKGLAPKIVGLPRVLLFVGVPVVLALLLNTGYFLFYFISAAIHAFFMYHEEKAKSKLTVERENEKNNSSLLPKTN
jgi:type III secretory pathway component EscU